jgi:hypothetical protein
MFLASLPLGSTPFKRSARPPRRGNRPNSERALQMLDKTGAGNPSGRHVSDAFFAQTIHAERKARWQQSAKVLRQSQSRGNDRLSGLAADRR